MSDTATLRRLAVSPNGFVFDPMTGATYTVNATGRVILEGLRDGLELPAIMESLHDAFVADAADLRRDVAEFTRTLREEGLLPAGFEVGGW